MRRAHLPLMLLALASLLIGLLPNALGAQEANPGQQLPAGPVVVRLYFGTQALLNQLVAEYDVWQVKHVPVAGTGRDDGYALVLLSPEEYGHLRSAGYRMELDEKNTALVQGTLVPPDYPCYRTVEETYATLQALNAAHPTLTELIDIGDSWDKATPGGPGGYDLYALRITNEGIPGPKPRFFLMAEIHAREMTTAETATRLAEYIMQRYENDPTVTFFVDYNEIYIVPMTNPDGRKIAETGVWWRKNTDSDDGCTNPDSWGTDLNRNYDYKWGCCGGSSPEPCNDGYRGPGRGTEPETQAIKDMVLSLFPDQNGPNGDDEVPPAAPITATGILITLHSAAGLVLWPWGWTGTDAPNAAPLEAIGTKLATYNGYMAWQSYDLYVTDGTTDDWSYGKLGIASYTFEMGRYFFENCSYMNYTVYPNNRDALLYAWKIAETPYMTAYGPDALDPAATPPAAAPGEAVQLTATIDDGQNGNQNIAAAEYYLLPLHDSTPPGKTGTGIPMQPVDGNLNSPHEVVVAAVDTAGHPAGIYLLAVRGQDAGGNWGPLSAAFLYLVEPGVSPVLEGYVHDGLSAAPLAAVVNAGDITTTADPATGYYSMTVLSGTYDMKASFPAYGPAYATGVTAADYQVVQQDFALYPSCEIFSDDMENGPGNWTTGGTHNSWALSSESYHSPIKAWSDSPGGLYANDTDSWVRSPTWDLSGRSGVTLSFWHSYDLEAGYDYGYVEYSTDGGASWALAGRYNGSSGWVQEEISLPELDGQSSAVIRFHLFSDDATQADGWHLDDVILAAGGPDCPALAAPVAGFSSNSPVVLGQPMLFTNESTGNPTPTYAWDFGDGSGTSTARNPTYIYLSSGSFTVTLTATNIQGSDVVTHPVEVLQPPCEPVRNAAFSWSPTTPRDGQAVSFQGSAQGTAPITYTWSFGDGTPPGVGRNPTHSYAAAGVYTVVMTAANCTTATQSVGHQLTVVAPQIAVSTVPTVTLDPGGIGGALLTITNTGDHALSWSLAEVTPTGWLDETPTAGQIAVGGFQTVTLGYTAPVTPGRYSAVLQVSSDDPLRPTVDVAVTLLVNELPPACVPVAGADFTWSPAAPYVTDTVTLTATVLAGDAPFTCSWGLGDGATAVGAVVTHVYTASGTYGVLLSATNCDGTVVVTATHGVVVRGPVLPEVFVVYLPIVVK